MLYHMPAEWAPQRSIWLTWPHDRSEWPGKFDAVEWVYAEIIRHISASQQVDLLVQDAIAQEQVQQMLTKAGATMSRVVFHLIKSDRIWLRDSGPTFVKDSSGKSMLLNWQFNAWAKYDNWQNDNQIPPHIAIQHAWPITQPQHHGKPVVLEGGSIEVNGAGLLLTTKECLLDQQAQVRNPGFTASDYQQIFSEYLGVDEVIWLNRGIAGDDTHGHVDDITRFVSDYTVITAIEGSLDDINHQPLQENLHTLKQYKTANGKSLDIIELPMPKALYFDGDRLPASYANFLICNEMVLVPTFNDANDRTALSIIAECFPNREIIGIHAVDLVQELGTLHCLSQQHPL